MLFIFLWIFSSDEHKLGVIPFVLDCKINPTWGLSILLVIAFFIDVLFVAIYNMCNVDHCKSLIFLQRVGIC